MTLPRVLWWLMFGALAVLPVGCGASESEPTSAAVSEASEPEEGHEHAAPHDGRLVELGEEFAHLELVLEPATGRLTAYVLDGEAEQAIRLTVPTLPLRISLPSGTAVSAELAAVANPLSGEAVGTTSQFSTVIEALKGATAFTGVVPSVVVRGQTFTDVPITFPADAH